MEFREMTKSDVEFVAKHSISRGVFGKMFRQTDFSWSLEHEGKILATGGIQLINPVAAWGWIDLTEYAQVRIFTVYRVIKEWMEKFCEDNKIKRLQAYIETDFPQAKRTVKHLGFEFESVMKNFMGDKDAHMYKRIFQWD